MKKLVYAVCSTKQDEFLIFGTQKRAEKWIENFSKVIFNKSTKEDLFVVNRVVF